jgi:hypothetical protein
MTKVLFITAVSAAALVLGQSSSTAPLVVVATHGTGATLELSMTNNSGKEIVASVVLVLFKTPKGSQIQAADVEDRTLRPGGSPLAPGVRATAEVSIPTQSGVELPMTETQVDYLLFSDGTSWGPDAAHLSLQIKGTRSGWAKAYRHLNATLTQQGKDAVVGEIQGYTALKSTPAKP